MSKLSVRRKGCLVLLALMFSLAGYALTDKPHVEATPLPVVYKSGALSADETWTAGNVYYLQSTVTVPNNITLTIDPGAVIKMEGSTQIFVDQGGNLSAVGTSSDHIIFTSTLDDSYGGDSGSDGSTVGAVGDYSRAIESYKGTVSLEYSDLLNGASSVAATCGPGVTVNVSHNNLPNQLALSSCSAGNASVVNNQMGSELSYRSAVEMNGSDPSILPLAGASSNVFSGTGTSRKVRLLSTSIASGSTWSVDAASNAVLYVEGLTVQGTLNIASGVIIKVESNNIGAEVADGGTVDVEGTSTDPVIMTSYKDDFWGGDTDGAGASTPSTGNYTGAISGSPGSHVTVNHATMQYGGYSVSFGCTTGKTSSLNVSDSVIRSMLFVGSCDKDSVSLKRNELNADYGYAVNFSNSDPSGAILSGADTNFAGNDPRGASVYLSSQDEIATGSTWTVSGEGNVTVVPANLEVRGTLNAESGAVLKAEYTTVYPAISVNNGATLNIDGTSTDKVTITSLKDDSLNGDTNGDGVSSGSATDYNEAIGFANGATIDISHAVIKNASYALFGGCNSDSTLNVADSEFRSTVYLTGCSSGDIAFKRNLINAAYGYGVEGLTTDMSYFSMSGTDKNYTNGTGKGAAVHAYISSTVPNGKTWSVSGQTGMVLVADGLTVNGELDLTDGQIVKSENTMGGSLVVSGGKIVASGTSTTPVTFTSISDDAAGGDTNGDGATSVSIGGYSTGIVVNSGGEADISHADMRYLAVAAVFYSATGKMIGVDVSDSLKGIQNDFSIVTFRGSFSNITNKSIESCIWGQVDCKVDATYTDWGNSGGPFANNQSQVCGEVDVTPWKYNGNTYNSGTLFDSRNCDNSPTVKDTLLSFATSYVNAVDLKQVDCGNGNQAACAAATTALQCLTSAANLAVNTYDISLPGYSGQIISALEADSFKDYMLDGVSDYVKSLVGEAVAGDNAVFVDALEGGIGMVKDISQAYNTCSP